MAKNPTKQNKKKQEFTLAKDKNQAIAGVVVFTVFVLKVCHTLYTLLPEAEVSQQLVMKGFIVLLLGALVVMFLIMLRPLLGIGIKSKSSQSKKANLKALQSITQEPAKTPKSEPIPIKQNVSVKSSAKLAKDRNQAILALVIFGAFALKVCHSLYVFSLEAEANMKIVAYAGAGVLLLTFVVMAFVLLKPIIQNPRQRVQKAEPIVEDVPTEALHAEETTVELPLVEEIQAATPLQSADNIVEFPKKAQAKLAKDKNQAFLALAIFGAFVLKTCHSLYMFTQEADPNMKILAYMGMGILLLALTGTAIVLLRPIFEAKHKLIVKPIQEANVEGLPKKTPLTLAKNKSQAFLALGIFGAFVLKISHSLYTFAQEASSAMQGLAYTGIGLFLFSLIAFSVVLLKPHFAPKAGGEFKGLAKDKNQAFLALGIFGAFALKVSHSLYVFSQDAEVGIKPLIYAGIGLLLFSIVILAVVLLAPHFAPKKDNVVEGSFTLAKDKNQAILAALIFGAFILKAGHSGYMYYQENQVEQANLPTIEMPNDLKKPANMEFNPTQRGGETVSEDEIDIIAVKDKPSSFVANKVLIPVADTMASNPFMPFKDEFNPALLPKFDMMAPPETLGENSEAQRVMSTTISGILYDNYSPSAIININGSDYLVKKGDIINNYKVLAIGRDKVVVQLGANVYTAGVGQILAQGNVNYNTVSNLNKKFGGSPEVLVNVRKQTY